MDELLGCLVDVNVSKRIIDVSIDVDINVQPIEVPSGKLT